MRRLSLFVLVALVSACATYPSHEIENGRYQNYRYGFVLNLPPGPDWVATNRSVTFEGSFPGEPRREVILTLQNMETGGAILLSAREAPFSPDEMAVKSKRIGVTMVSTLEKGSRTTEARLCKNMEKYLEEWDSCVEVEGLTGCFVPSERTKGIIFVRYFPIKNRINEIMINFFSTPVEYGQDFSDFIQVLESLRQGNEYTVGQ